MIGAPCVPILGVRFQVDKGEVALGALFLEGGTGASLEMVRGGGVGLFVLVLGVLMVDGAVLGVWRDGGEAFGALFLGEGT